MRSLVLLAAVVTCLASSSQQQPGPQAPVAGGGGGSGAEALCERLASCGCGEESCVDNVRAQMSNEAYLGCVAQGDCESVCNPDGSQLITDCVAQYGGPNGEVPGGGAAGSGGGGGGGGGPGATCARSMDCASGYVCCRRGDVMTPACVQAHACFPENVVRP